jgi:lysyl-tRNA synthetase class 2
MCRPVIYGYQRYFSNKKSSSGNNNDVLTIREARIKKLNILNENNMLPFAYNYHKTHNSKLLHAQYHLLKNEEEDKSNVIHYAGRVMMKRLFGKLAFFEMNDEHGKIQLYLDKAILSDEFNKMKELIDNGNDSFNSTVLDFVNLCIYDI